MNQSASSKGMRPTYVHRKNVDGSALAGGWEDDKSTISGYSNAIEVNHCGFHVKALSSKDTLGVAGRRYNEIEQMGKTLKKCTNL